MNTIGSTTHLPTIIEEAENAQPTNRLQHQPQAAQAAQAAQAVQIHSTITMSACDKLTMETMMNMDTYSKCIKRRTTPHQQLQADSAERKFYRRRIIDITKELCRSSGDQDAGNADSAVLIAFNAYVRTCIMHFKFVDLADTLQDEYAGLAGSCTTVASELSDLPNLHNLSDLSKFDKLCFNPAANGGDHPPQSKTVQISAPSSSNSLERLFMAKSESSKKEVGDKTDDKTLPDPVASVVSTSFLSGLPKIKDVNLMDEQFKTKGINSVGRGYGRKKGSKPAKPEMNDNKIADSVEIE